MSLAPYIPKTFLEYQTALQNCLLARGSSLSNFNPNSRISAVLDAIASVLSEGDVRTLNGFRYSIREGVYNAFGFPRLPGLNAVGILRISVNSNTTDTLFPIFTLDLFGLSFKSIAPVTLKAGEPYVEIEVRAILSGTDYNITRFSIDTDEGLGSLDFQPPAGTRFWNPTDFSGGTNSETEESRLKRFQDFILSLGRSTPLGIYNAVASIPSIAGVEITTNINPISNTFEIGWVNVYISDGTSNPPQSLLESVRKILTGDLNDPVNYPGYAAAGTFVYVSPIPVVGISCDFTLELINSSSLLLNDALNLALNALTLYINTLPVGYDVLLDQVIASILKANPDFYDIKINILYGKLSSNPVPNPLPVPSNVVIPNNSIGRTGGTSGGVLTGNVISVVPS